MLKTILRCPCGEELHYSQNKLSSYFQICVLCRKKFRGPRVKTGRGSRTLIVQAREDDKLDKVVPGTVDDLGCIWEAGSPCLTDELRVEVSKMKNWAWLL